MSEDYDGVQPGGFYRFDVKDPPEVLVVKLGGALNEIGQGIRRLDRRTEQLDKDVRANFATKAEVKGLKDDMQKKFDSYDKIIFWGATTILGSIAAGVIMFFMKGGAS